MVVYSRKEQQVVIFQWDKLYYEIIYEAAPDKREYEDVEMTLQH